MGLMAARWSFTATPLQNNDRTRKLGIVSEKTTGPQDADRWVEGSQMTRRPRFTGTGTLVDRRVRRSVDS
jgi:hypothetical protein